MSDLVRSSIRFALLAAWVAGLLSWEYKRSLRRVVDSKAERDVRNLAVAGLAATAVQLFEVPVALGLAGRAQQERSGLLWLAPVPDWTRTAAAILLLDYTLYLW